VGLDTKGKGSPVVGCPSFPEYEKPVRSGLPEQKRLDAFGTSIAVIAIEWPKWKAENRPGSNEVRPAVPS
jgi:hypothetical protein